MLRPLRVRVAYSLAALALWLLAVSAAQAASVWLDFGSWTTELDKATTAAGVPNFSAAEQAQIEANILSSVQTAYSVFDMNFFTSNPGGTRERVVFNATTSDPNLLGAANLDFRNLSASIQSVYTGNFGFILSAASPRAQQIQDISTALAGTAAHELGHAVGMRHHAAYGTAAITPANYGNTGGLQNQHIMATGPTGLTAAQRKVERTFSAWSLLTMEAAQGIPLVPNPLPITSEIGDAGIDYLSAQPLTLTPMPLSGLAAALVVNGQISTPADIDFYSFPGLPGDLVSVELWSVDRKTNSFNGKLSLIGPDGTSLLFENDGVRYSGNTFDSGTLHTIDAFLLNIPLVQSGTHYIKVESIGNGANGTSEGFYDLLVGIHAVPEPSAIALGVAAILLVAVFRRWRKRR